MHQELIGVQGHHQALHHCWQQQGRGSAAVWCVALPCPALAAAGCCHLSDTLPDTGGDNIWSSHQEMFSRKPTAVNFIPVT